MNREIKFTGRKDKNGKKIYEGDIIDSEFIESGLIDFRHNDFIVILKPECRSEMEGENRFDYLHMCNDIEVIGNKDENGDLLK